MSTTKQDPFNHAAIRAIVISSLVFLVLPIYQTLTGNVMMLMEFIGSRWMPLGVLALVYVGFPYFTLREPMHPVGKSWYAHPFAWVVTIGMTVLILWTHFVFHYMGVTYITLLGQTIFIP